MSDVSTPPIHPDNELVTRRVLREELSQYPTKEELRDELSKELSQLERRLMEAILDVQRQIGGMKEHIMTLMAPILEPYNTHASRLTQVEARTTILIERVDALEAQRIVRRPKKRVSRRRNKARK